MERILKKYTTIPPQLYVDRNADIQLKKIIEDMQRPGYVLVARQMGKTNLLINAKRSLENVERIIVYVDLSNLYDNERDCYQNIINNIIELNFEIFDKIEADLNILRLKESPPHNEYLRSLLLILKNFSGDLVIILDEVDALKSVEYSDNIFAQIRSTYFSRINFKELERLTYILSGVIEPTELIKDRNKSPFNIGDKIYLDDFTLEEHNTFIYKAKLQISNELSDEIFNWTNGNPRLTFDICAELEKQIINNNQPTLKSLETLINKKYLTTFDVAPIDHIRELIKDNKAVRKSIMQIISNDVDSVSEGLKSKLYLYGIINSKFAEKTKIKNKIIEKALNIEWLKSLDDEKTLQNGIIKYSSGLYLESKDIFEFIVETSDDSSEIESAQAHLALSYYGLDQFDSAIVHFNYDYKNQLLKNQVQAYHGLSLLKLGDKSGIAFLEKVVKNESHDKTYQVALLNLAINISDNNRSLQLLEILLSEENIIGSVDEINDLKALVLFYQSTILQKNNNYISAQKKIEEALNFSNKNDTVILLYNQIKLKEFYEIDLRKECESLVKYIVKEKIKFNSRTAFPFSFDLNGVGEILIFLFEENNNENFISLLEYISVELFKNRQLTIDLLLNLKELASPKFEKILLFTNSYFKDYLTSHQEININRLLVSLQKNDDKYFSLLDEYNHKLIVDLKYNLIEDDITLLNEAIQKLQTIKKFDKIIEICDFSEKKLENISDNFLKPYLVLFAFWRSVALFQKGNKFNSLTSIDKTLKILNIYENNSNPILDSTTVNNLKSQILNLRETITKPTNNQNSSTKLIRNQIITVKYKNGKIAHGKFKRFEKDLLDGKCAILVA